MMDIPSFASKPIYFILDVRDCFEDEDAAMAAARSREGHAEGHIFLYSLQPCKEYAPFVEAMPDDDEEEKTDG